MIQFDYHLNHVHVCGLCARIVWCCVGDVRCCYCEKLDTAVVYDEASCLRLHNRSAVSTQQSISQPQAFELVVCCLFVRLLGARLTVYTIREVCD